MHTIRTRPQKSNLITDGHDHVNRGWRISKKTLIAYIAYCQQNANMFIITPSADYSK